MVSLHTMFLFDMCISFQTGYYLETDLLMWSVVTLTLTPNTIPISVFIVVYPHIKIPFGFIPNLREHSEIFFFYCGHFWPDIGQCNPKYNQNLHFHMIYLQTKFLFHTTLLTKDIIRNCFLGSFVTLSLIERP